PERCFFVLLMPPSGDPGALHSFPTRRSSDLMAQPRGGGTVRGDHARGAGTRGRGDPRAGAAAGRRRGGAVRAAGGIGEARLPAEDRKSTRLNSSHDQISYAVFCLKKKKITVA